MVKMQFILDMLQGAITSARPQFQAKTDHLSEIVQENNKTELITGLLRPLLLRSSNGLGYRPDALVIWVRIPYEGCDY